MFIWLNMKWIQDIGESMYCEIDFTMNFSMSCRHKVQGPGKKDQVHFEKWN